MKDISYTLVITIFFSVVIFSQQNWYEQYSGSNRELTDVNFIDENTGWVCGWTGTILKTTNSGQNWETLQNVPSNNAYYSISFTDSQNGWATGYNGKIIHTTNGGETWSNQISPIATDLYKVFFINPQIGWIVGGDNGVFPSNISKRVILFTSDGGYSWTTQIYQTSKPLLKSIYFTNKNNGYATGEGGIILHTTNGGNTWTEQIIFSGYHFFDVFFSNNNKGYVVGEYLGLPHYSVVYKTSDGGSSWMETALGTDETLTAIFFTDSLNGWAAGNDYGNGNLGIIYHTIDGGEDWVYQDLPTVNGLFNLFFVNGSRGWSTGHLGTIIAYDHQVPVELNGLSANIADDIILLTWSTVTETNNQGFEIERSEKLEAGSGNWVKIGFVNGKGTTTETQSYSFIDRGLPAGRQGLGAGKYQYRLKQIDFNGSYSYSKIVAVDVGMLNDFVLEQNYPNPFNPATKISYSLPRSSLVTLKVFNILGQEVATLVNEEIPAGSYDIDFNAAILPSGVYFYQLKAGEDTAVKKMILLK